MKKPKFYDNYHLNNKNKKYFSVISEYNFTYYLNIQYIHRVLTSIKKKKIKIIDLGCGVGTIDFFLAKKGHDIVGIDVSQDAINICNAFKDFNKQVNTKFLRGDLGKIKLEKGEFDLAICSEVIEHIENDEKLLQTINATLKKGGYLFLTTPSENAPLHRLGLLKEFDRKVGHLRRYNQHQLKEKLQKNGFEIVEMGKNESILRNSLYTFPYVGKVIKIIRGPLVIWFHIVDNFLVKVFGESNLIFICRKK